MRLPRHLLIIAACAAGAGALWRLDAETIPLVLPAGTPLEVRLDHRVLVHRIGEPVSATVVRPVFAVDRTVIPEGTRATGVVVELAPVSRQKRLRSVMNGDFTPLRIAKIRFDKLVFSDGREVPIKTANVLARGPVVRPSPGTTPMPKTTGWGKPVAYVWTAMVNAKAQFVAAWKSDDRWERLQETGFALLPYHPQYVPSKTQLLAELSESLPAGFEEMSGISGEPVVLPPADTTIEARMTSSVTSKSSPGTPITAVMSAPLYSAAHRLLLPEGTRLFGTVQMSQPASSWRRGGELRIAFQSLQLPESFPSSKRMYHFEAIVAAIATPTVRGTKVDAEGVTRVQEPLSRFLVPALKLVMDTQYIDSDQQSHAAQRTWGTLIGASGYGVLGSAAAQISREAATGLGFYGLGWSVFTHIIARGRDVVLPRDTAVIVKFITAPA